MFFTKQQLFWQCSATSHGKSSLRACEAFPTSMPEQVTDQNGPVRAVTFPLPRLVHDDNRLPDWQLLWGWAATVDKYTCCQLSYHSDILVALGGIARVIQSYTGDEYVAGLWRKDLLVHLVWEVAGPAWDTSPSAPASYVAPSWSWASRRDQISSRAHSARDREPELYDPLADVIDVSVETVSSDVFGQVKGASLRLKGYLIPIILRRRGGSEESRRSTKRDTEMWGQQYRHLSVSLDDELCDAESVIFFPLFRWTRPRHGIEGLLLSAVCKAVPSFRRLGKGSISNLEPADAFESVLSTCQRREVVLL